LAGAEASVADAAAEGGAVGAAALRDGVAIAGAVTAAACAVGAALRSAFVVDRRHGDAVCVGVGVGCHRGRGGGASFYLSQDTVGAAVVVGRVASVTASVQTGAAVSLGWHVVVGVRRGRRAGFHREGRSDLGVGRANRVRRCDVAGACCARVAAGEEAGTLAGGESGGADNPNVGRGVISA